MSASRVAQAFSRTSATQQRAALLRATTTALQHPYRVAPVESGGASRRRRLSSVALNGENKVEDGERRAATDRKMAHEAVEGGGNKRPTRRRIPRERPAPITLTDRAASHLTKLLASKPGKVGVRLGVKRRGCNGMSYTMKYADEKPKGDEEVVVQAVVGKESMPGDGAVEALASTQQADGRGVTAKQSDPPAEVRSDVSGGAVSEDGERGGVIAPSSSGARLFVDPMATLYIAGTVMDWEETELSSEFTFRNPNAKGECGCGESFNV